MRGRAPRRGCPSRPWPLLYWGCAADKRLSPELPHGAPQDAVDAAPLADPPPHRRPIPFALHDEGRSCFSRRWRLNVMVRLAAGGYSETGSRIPPEQVEAYRSGEPAVKPRAKSPPSHQARRAFHCLPLAGRVLAHAMIRLLIQRRTQSSGGVLSPDLAGHEPVFSRYLCAAQPGE